MRIIISPAKKMNIDTDSLAPIGLPKLLEKTNIVKSWLQSLNHEELKKLWGCNDKIAKLNFERLQNMNLEENLTPAILSYEGIQYQYMAPTVMDRDALDYIQEHLRILSGFYGILKPLDGVVPYRLEMQAKANVDGHKNLYSFWGKRLAETLFSETDTIINLASKEYSKCVSSHLTPDITFITCVFGEYVNGKVVEKGTYAKMARGEMVRFLAEQKAETPEVMKQFDRLGYVYDADASDEKTYVFIKK